MKIKNIDDLKLKWNYYPSKLLFQKTEPVADEDIPLAVKIGEKMKEMLMVDGGLGLAANQAGLDISIAIVAFPNDKNEYVNLQTLINPEIIFESPKTVIDAEGCLSFPELFSQVERPYEVIVRANLEGKGMTTFQARGLLARILCHEIDHLNGITIEDRLCPLEKEIAQPFLDRFREKYGEE